jgi:5-methylcytosine-specific restriction endonuclease McrBC GTP-binding regulatory subunit McrB
MTYQNAQQARQDLYLFGTRNLIDVLQSSFSMNQILPRNRFIEFDVNEYLGMNETDVVVEPRAQDRETETL